jgi:hypothetical protein
MDRSIPQLPAAATGDTLERALLEVDAAISLVVAGIAVTITPAPVSLVVGPRLRPVAAGPRRELES